MRLGRLASAVSVGVWLVVVASGLGILLSYATTPGDIGDPPRYWPKASTIERAEGMSTLVMFAHPRCPCTRASLAELERIMARSGGRLSAVVAFLSPSSEAAGWAKTDLWDRASAISGVRAVEDVDGREARRFHVATSGHALVYDASGAKTFSGGITSARGHEGTTAGGRAIAEGLSGSPAPDAGASVFGCSLFDAETHSAKETTVWHK